MFNPTAFPQKSEESLFKLNSPLHLELALPTPSPLGTQKPTLSAVLALKSRIYCAESRENFEAYTVRGHRQTEHPRRSPLGEAGVEREGDRALLGISVSVKPEFGNCKTLLLGSKTGSSGNL